MGRGEGGEGEVAVDFWPKRREEVERGPGPAKCVEQVVVVGEKTAAAHRGGREFIRQC